MSDKKTDLLLCIACGMCGTKDSFTPESNDTCKKCSRVRQLEQRVRYSEERSLEAAMKSLEIRVSDLEQITRQKNDGDLLERGSSHTYPEDAVQRKEGRSAEQPKDKKPVEESAAKDVGGKVAKDIALGPLSKADLEEKINAAIKEKQYFIIGVAKRDGTAKESMAKYEQRSPNLDEKNIQAISDYRMNRVKVFYGNIPKKKNGCALESQRLLDVFRKDKFCLNAESGEDEWLREKDTEEGIVFLHVYSA